MIAEFANGYRLEAAHFPGRKKPLLVLTHDGEYIGHAVFSDEKCCHEFKKFMAETWDRRAESSMRSSE
jgi:hypothetical protein